MPDHYIEAQTHLTPFGGLVEDPVSKAKTRAFVIGLAAKENYPLPTDSGEEQIEALRKFGALYITRSKGSALVLGNGPGALPTEDRADVLKVLAATTEPRKGKSKCFHRAVVMHLIYVSFGYRSVMFSMGMGPQKGPFNHSVNMIFDPERAAWCIHDSHLGCRIFSEERSVHFGDFFNSLAALEPDDNIPFREQLDHFPRHMSNPDRQSDLEELHALRDDFFSKKRTEIFASSFAPLGLHTHWLNLFLFPKRLMGDAAASQLVEQCVSALQQAGKSSLLDNDWRKQQRLAALR